MPRLPIPGGDDGAWGTILNEFLSVELDNDGKLKRAAQFALKDDVDKKYEKPGSGIPSADIQSMAADKIDTSGAALNNVIKFDGSKATWGAPSGTVTVPSTTNLIKGDGSGGMSAATPGTDYLRSTDSLNPANLSSAVAVGKGGTGATDAAGARTNLGLGTAAQSAAADFAASNHAHAINDLSDVTVTTPSSGQYVRYNGTGWVNAGVDASDVATGTLEANVLPLIAPAKIDPTGAQNGQVLKYTGGNVTWSSDLTSNAGTSTVTANVKAFGAVGDGSANDTAAINDALTALGTNEGILFFPTGTYLYTGSLSLAGKRCVIQGEGSGTVIKAASQSGPVLDLTGFRCPDNALGQNLFGNFDIQGDGTAGAAKIGIKLAPQDSVTPNSLVFRNIGIYGTGGAGLWLDSIQFCLFENVAIHQPVGANANDVPHMYIGGDANGNRFVSCGLRAYPGTSGASAPSGCIAMGPDEAYTPTDNAFTDCWDEGIRVPEGGCLLHMKGSKNTINDWRTFDTNAATDNTTDTCFFRLAPAAFSDMGGNSVRGHVPGYTGQANEIRYGMIITQNNNVVDGTRGYQYNNVLIKAGVQYTTVILAGSVNPPANRVSNPTVIDQSGNLTNVYLDTNNHTWNLADTLITGGTVPITQVVSEVGSNTYTLSVRDSIIECDASAANLTINAPLSTDRIAMTGHVVTIKNVGTSGTVTFNELVDADSPAVLTARWQSMTVYYNGTDWRYVSRYP